MGQERYTPEEREKYRLLLSSPYWKALRKRRISLAGGRCEFGLGTQERCVARSYLEVHHNTYERLWCELDSDLDVYCWFHHRVEHLLWKKCKKCLRPCLLDEKTCSHWLTSVLLSMEIDPEHIKDWSQLPNKNFLLQMVPDTCSDCEYL